MLADQSVCDRQYTGSFLNTKLTRILADFLATANHIRLIIYSSCSQISRQLSQMIVRCGSVKMFELLLEELHSVDNKFDDIYSCKNCAQECKLCNSRMNLLC
jgi:hypothetical protein